MYLHLALGKWQRQVEQPATTKLLGETRIPKLPSNRMIRQQGETDYFGKRRNSSQPAPGPFENW
jgi:hypothetical protein